jgi:hypothetical protein
VIGFAVTILAPSAVLAQSAEYYLGFSFPAERRDWWLRSPFTEVPIHWQLGQINIYEPLRIEYYAEYRDPWGAFHTFALEPNGSKVYLNGVIYRPDGLFAPWRVFPRGTVLFDFDAPQGSVWLNELGIVVVTNRHKVVATGEGVMTDCVQFWVVSWEGSQTIWTFAPGVGLVQFGETDWAFILR